MKIFKLYFIVFHLVFFASAKLFAETVSVFPYTESFEGGIGVWESSDSNDFDWVRYAYNSVSLDTGPDSAADGIIYVLAEASSPGIPFKTGSMEANFVLTNLALPELSFFYHMYGRDMGSLHVDVFDGNWHSSVWSRTGQQHLNDTDPWSLAIVPLSFYSTSTSTTIRLRSVTTSDYRCDVAVDKIQIGEGAASTYLISPFQTWETNPGGVVEYQLNIGNSSGTNFEFLLTYSGDWSPAGPASSGMLDHGEATTVTFQVQVDAGALHGESRTTTVTAISSDYVFTNDVEFITHCTWSRELLEEGDFDNWPEGWTNYFFGAVTGGWYHDMRFGAVLPSCASHDEISGVSNWFVSPAINLSSSGGEKLAFAFSYACADTETQPKIFISTGSRDPSAGDFTLLAEISSVPVIWTRNEIDLTPYMGFSPVYLAFCYSASNGWQSIDGVSVTACKTGIDNAVLKTPSTISVDCYQPIPSIEASLNIPGETGGSGPASDISAEVGIGLRNTDPVNGKWTWTPIPYVGADGNNDSFATSLFMTVSGDFDFACRFRKGVAEWIYADLDGSTNGYSSVAAGKMTVNMLSTQGVELLEQTISTNPAVGILSYYDPTNQPGISFIAADDLSFFSTTTVKTVRWGGMYGNSGRIGNERGFNIIIYDNSAENTPGTTLYEENVPGYACEQFQAYAPIENVDVYLYHWNLTTPFNAVPEKTYWISIQQNNVFETHWSVMNSTNTLNGFASMQYDVFYGEWRTGAETDLGIMLYGDRGLFSHISLAPNKLIFPDTVFGETNDLELTVQNIGDFSVSGVASNVTAPFSIVGSGSYDILPASNAVLTFRFNPLTVGAFSNIVTLTGANNPTLELEGFGIPEPVAVLFLLLASLGLKIYRK